MRMLEIPRPSPRGTALAFWLAAIPLEQGRDVRVKVIRNDYDYKLLIDLTGMSLLNLKDQLARLEELGALEWTRANDLPPGRKSLCCVKLNPGHWIWHAVIQLGQDWLK